MPDYGDVEYWNHRYEIEITDTFDWLFEYEHVAAFMLQLVKMSEEILIVGSGNAQFSKDMYDAGYMHLINIDLSDVVIEIMQKKHPEMQWQVMDALDLKFPSGSFPAIVDKSLIDTFLCYQNSIPCTKQFLRECHRVLAPSAVMISFSLHSPEEILPFFEQEGLDWTYAAFKVVNPRWDEEDNCHRSVAHTMVVSQKNPRTLPIPLQLDGVLIDEEYQRLKAMADEIRDVDLFRKASVSDMITCLEVAVHLHSASISQLKPQRLGVDAMSDTLATGTRNYNKPRGTVDTGSGVNEEQAVAAS